MVPLQVHAESAAGVLNAETDRYALGYADAIIREAKVPALRR